MRGTRERTKSCMVNKKEENSQNSTVDMLAEEVLTSLSKNVVFTTKAGMVSFKKDVFLSTLCSLMEVAVG